MPSKLELEVITVRQENRILRLEQDLEERGRAHVEIEGALLKAQSEIEHLTRQRDAVDESYKNAKTKEREAIEARDKTQAQFAELKARLFAAEGENRELRGYIARVREDDSVRDGVQIITDEIPRAVPRRMPAPQIHSPLRGYQNGDAAAPMTAREIIAGAEQQPRHWTSYGDRR